jgi:tRNA 2-thiouridine synthesizing protein A
VEDPDARVQEGTRMIPPTRPAPALTIDALGRKCPIPIIMLAERIREIPIGATVAVLADDPAARPDIPAWCMMKSQEFVAETELPRGWAFLIRRTY